MRILITCLTLGCLSSAIRLPAQDPAVNSIVREAIANMYGNRDNAKRRLDSLRSDWQALSAADQVVLFNAFGIYFGMEGQVDSATYFFRYIIDHSTDEQFRGNAMLNLSNVLREKGLNDQALSLQKQAEELYLRLGDQKKLATLYGEMASTFRQQSMYDPAVEYLLRAIELLEQLPDSTAQRPVLLIIRQKLANTYLIMEDDSFAHRIYREIIPAFRADSNEWNLAISLLNHAEVLRRMGLLPKAFESVDEALAILSRYDNAEYLAYALRTKANIARTAGRPRAEIRSYFEAARANTRYPDNEYGQFLFSDYLKFLTAERMFPEADSLIRTIDRLQVFRTANFAIRRDYHRARAETFQGLGRWPESTAAAMTATDYADSLNRFNLLTQAKGLQEQYKSRTFQQEAQMSRLVQAELERKIRIRNLNLLASLLFVVVLVVLTLYYRLQLRYKVFRLHRLEEEQRMAFREQQLLNEKTSAQQQVIRLQQDQLTENALELARKHEELEHLLGKLQDQDRQEMTQAILSMKEGTQQREALMVRFGALYPDYLKRLKDRFPELTQSDLEFCALVRLNLSYKDIANVMNIRHQSVFTKKYRITQKMRIEEDHDFQALLLEM